MSSYLEELTGLRKSGEVVLRESVKVTVRGLSMDETRAAQDAFDSPVPPKMKDPTKGSAAPPIDNTADPAFVRAARVYDDDVKAACVAVATGLVVLGEDEKANAAALKAAAKRVRATMHDAEVNAVIVKMNELSSVARGVETAMGNSSAPSSQAAAGPA